MMIRYSGSPETTHVVNWILFGGHHDPGKLVRQAEETYFKVEPKHGRTVEDFLAGILFGIVAEAVCRWTAINEHELNPDFDEVCLADTPQYSLLAPLISAMLFDRIDTLQAARIILDLVRDSRERPAGPNVKPSIN